MAIESGARTVVAIEAPEGAQKVFFQDHSFPPYVVEGEEFVPGQILCKFRSRTFGERKIVAARPGKVITIYVKNGEDVETGQRLLSVEWADESPSDYVVAGMISWETALRMRPQETIECPEDGSETEVASPLEGVFYCARSPDSSPFVQVGDIVSRGQIVCVVMAMKTINAILYCGKRPARVVSIEVGNEKLVKPGEILIRLEPIEDGRESTSK